MLAFLALIKPCRRLITSPHLFFPSSGFLMLALRAFFLNQRPCLNILNNLKAFLFLITFLRNNSAFSICLLPALRTDQHSLAANFLRQHYTSAFRTKQHLHQPHKLQQPNKTNLYPTKQRNPPNCLADKSFFSNCFLKISRATIIIPFSLKILLTILLFN